MCKFLHLKLLAVIIIISYDKSANYINKTILLPRFVTKIEDFSLFYLGENENDLFQKLECFANL